MPQAPPTPAGFPFQKVFMGSIGTALEWYDFGVYGFFAATIGRQFFPAQDGVSSLIAAFGAFAAGFLARPFGAVIFGQLGDRWGRSFALTASVLLMAIPTFCIGLLPTHAMIGPLAGVLLVICRILQGLSVGGEHTTSMVFLVEHAPDRHKGLAGSFAPFAASLGILMGSGVGTLLEAGLSREQLDAWGWRIPQLVGLILAGVGIWIRYQHRNDDAPTPVGDSNPLWDTWKQDKGMVLKVFGLTLMSAIGFYMIFVYLATYLPEIGGTDAVGALEINTISMVFMLGLIPFFGWLSDLWGPLPLMWASCLGLLLFSWPLFFLMQQGSWLQDLLAEFGFVLVLTPIMGSAPSALCGMLDSRRRCTVLSLGFNLCMGLVGGTTPLLAESLRGWTHNDLAPAYYLIFGALVTAITLAIHSLTERRADLIPLVQDHSQPGKS